MNKSTIGSVLEVPLGTCRTISAKSRDKNVHQVVMLNSKSDAELDLLVHLGNRTKRFYKRQITG